MEWSPKRDYTLHCFIHKNWILSELTSTNFISSDQFLCFVSSLHVEFTFAFSLNLGQKALRWVACKMLCLWINRILKNIFLTNQSRKMHLKVAWKLTVNEFKAMEIFRFLTHWICDLLQLTCLHFSSLHSWNYVNIEVWTEYLVPLFYLASNHKRSMIRIRSEQIRQLLCAYSALIFISLDSNWVWKQLFDQKNVFILMVLLAFGYRCQYHTTINESIQINN